MKKPLPSASDREKAVYMLHKATADAPAVCAGRVLKEFDETEIACLAHAFDDGERVYFVHEVIAHQATRKNFQSLAASRVAKQVAAGPHADVVEEAAAAE